MPGLFVVLKTRCDEQLKAVLLQTNEEVELLDTALTALGLLDRRLSNGNMIHSYDGFNARTVHSMIQRDGLARPVPLKIYEKI